MAEPWDMTPAQRQQFREAQARRKERELARIALPYLDASGDLHVTAAMAHEITEAFRVPAPAATTTPVLDLVDRLEAIVGRDRWPAIWRQVQSRPAANPILLGMRIVIDEQQ